MDLPKNVMEIVKCKRWMNAGVNTFGRAQFLLSLHDDVQSTTDMTKILGVKHPNVNKMASVLEGLGLIYVKREDIPFKSYRNPNRYRLSETGRKLVESILK